MTQDFNDTYRRAVAFNAAMRVTQLSPGKLAALIGATRTQIERFRLAREPVPENVLKWLEVLAEVMRRAPRLDTATPSPVTPIAPETTQELSASALRTGEEI